MADKLLRGRVLSFKSRPESIDDHNSYVFFEDGAVHDAVLVPRAAQASSLWSVRAISTVQSRFHTGEPAGATEPG